MTGVSDPEFPALTPAAVALLTAIRDHLDIPLYRERSAKDRRAFLELLEIRHADVVGALNALLAVPDTDALDHAAQLRQLAAETPATHRTTAQASRGERL